MRFSSIKPVIIGGGAAAAVIAIAGAASGTGIGGVFNLGRTNKVNAKTTLTGAARQQPMLSVTNTSTGPALSLQVSKGKAPFSVNSATQVANLNASLLGGLAASQFVQGGGQSRSFGFSMPTSANASRELLSVPGFGTFSATCGSNGVQPPTLFADVAFKTGSHEMDKFVASLTNGSDVGVGNSSLSPNTNFAIAETQSPGISAVWERLTLRYATGSGQSQTEHIATADIMVDASSTTCDFDASATIGPGAKAP